MAEILTEDGMPSTETTLRATISKVLNEYEAKHNIVKHQRKETAKTEIVKDETPEQDEVEETELINYEEKTRPTIFGNISDKV